MEEIIKILDENYYGSTALINDKLYDKIRIFINNKFSESSLCKKIGYVPEDKVRLKYFMGSENKTYLADNKLINWIDEYGTDDLILSAKADGISVLWDIYHNQIFSRGNGKYGKNISHFIEYFNFSDDKNLSNAEILNNGIKFIRGELIINKPNNRNIVSGQVNRNEINVKLASQIYFVAYEILEPRMPQYDQFIEMEKIKIRTVKYFKKNKSIISYSYLSKLYKKLVSQTKYDIDGIIIRNNNLNSEIKSGNPPWSICFKETDDVYTTTIKEIVWEISKKNIYIPKALLEPIIIGNSTINVVPCYNAKFVLDNKINTGSIIEIIKKGGVIPMINKIVKESDIEITLPPGNLSGVNLLYEGINKDSEIKKILYFFKYLGYKNINIKIIIKLYDKGYTNILKYIENDINITEYNNKKTYIKLIDSINDIKHKNYSIVEILSALSLNDLSYAKLCNIYNKMPNFLKDKTVKDYSIIDGIGVLSSNKINTILINNYDFIINILNVLNIKY